MTECKRSPSIYEEFDQMPMFRDDNPNPNYNLLHGILKHGFDRPSVIQKKAIVPLSEGRNVIAQSQSGTGKTGSFVIGSLSRLDPTLDAVQIIIMAHTHELADQIISVVKSIGSHVIDPKKVEYCVGRRVSVEQNIMNISKGSQILVGTPGRIRDLVFRKIGRRPEVHWLIDPKKVRVVILDEADRLLSRKFHDTIAEIIDHLDRGRAQRDALQLGIFSATMPTKEGEEENKEALEKARILCVPDIHEQGPDWVNDPGAPVEILVPLPELSLEGIQQFYYEFDCNTERESFEQKSELILLLNEEQFINQCIIYVNNQDRAVRLMSKLTSQELNCACIYGDMPPAERTAIIKAFRRCESRILVSTDLLSRGFDVQQISLVINFDLPYVNNRNTGGIDQEKMSEYLHRIGRSGRFGRKGLAINLVSGASEMTRLKSIMDYYEVDIPRLPDDVSEIGL